MAKKEVNISDAVTLPCGLTIPNRLSKAAMAEGWAGKDRLPKEQLINTYNLWGEGGWGIIMTGNVHVDDRYLGTPEDVALNQSISRQEHIDALSKWARASSKDGAAGFVQINHPGRQSTIGAGTRSYFSKSLAPSAIGVSLGPGLVAKAAGALVFGTPLQMTDLQIEDVVHRFATTAKIVQEAGFQGVEIHAAHGYLLSSFLNRKSNQRNDAYGGTPTKRAKIVVDIIHATRAVVPKDFAVGIKINSADHQSPAELEDILEQLTAITDAGVDFLEISGGNYEDPTMLEATTEVDPEEKVSASTAARESFFLDFAKAIRSNFPNVLLMVTGGFRTRLGLEYAVKSGACDFVGIGRPAVIEPALPNTIVFNKKVSDEDARLPTKSFRKASLARTLGIKGLGGGTETLGYVAEIHRMLQSAAGAKI